MVFNRSVIHETNIQTFNMRTYKDIFNALDEEGQQAQIDFVLKHKEFIEVWIKSRAVGGRNAKETYKEVGDWIAETFGVTKFTTCSACQKQARYKIEAVYNYLNDEGKLQRPVKKARSNQEGRAKVQRTSRKSTGTKKTKK